MKLATVLLSALFAAPMFCAPREMTFADGFNGASWEETIEETIHFSYKQDEETFIEGTLPTYYDMAANSNPCAPVAGSIVLGYYDQYYDNMIENFTSTRVIFGMKLYNSQTDAVQTVINQLYSDMGTNTTEGGTTINGFKSGMTTYVGRKGRSVTFSQRVYNQSVLSNLYKQSIQNERPVVLFVSHYSLVDLADLSEQTGTEDVFVQHYGGNHTLIGYGMRTVKYYNAASNLVRQLDLLAVATGFPDYPLAYIILDDYTNIIDGFEINIS